jgi:hypothetical protein
MTNERVPLFLSFEREVFIYSKLMFEKAKPPYFFNYATEFYFISVHLEKTKFSTTLTAGINETQYTFTTYLK